MKQSRPPTLSSMRSLPSRCRTVTWERHSDQLQSLLSPTTDACLAMQQYASGLQARSALYSSKHLAGSHARAGQPTAPRCPSPGAPQELRGCKLLFSPCLCPAAGHQQLVHCSTYMCTGKNCHAGCSSSGQEHSRATGLPDDQGSRPDARLGRESSCLPASSLVAIKQMGLLSICPSVMQPAACAATLSAAASQAAPPSHFSTPQQGQLQAMLLPASPDRHKPVLRAAQHSQAAGQATGGPCGLAGRTPEALGQVRPCSAPRLSSTSAAACAAGADSGAWQAGTGSSGVTWAMPR